LKTRIPSTNFRNFRGSNKFSAWIRKRSYLSISNL
jgi:hypothetical protein